MPRKHGAGGWQPPPPKPTKFDRQYRKQEARKHHEPPRRSRPGPFEPRPAPPFRVGDELDEILRAAIARRDERRVVARPRGRHGRDGGGARYRVLLSLLLVVMLMGSVVADTHGQIERHHRPREQARRPGALGSGGSVGSPDSSRAVAIRSQGQLVPRGSAPRGGAPHTGAVAVFAGTPGSYYGFSSPGGMSTTAVRSSASPGLRERVGNFLRSAVEVIRIATGGSGHGGGFGHRAAVVALMDEVVDLGFEGTFQIVYDNRSGVATQLPTLLPGFDPHTRNQTLRYRGNPLVATERSTFQQQHLRDHPRYIGMVAATDHPQLWTDYLGVLHAVELQPHHWGWEDDTRRLQIQGRDPIPLRLPPESVYHPRIESPWVGPNQREREGALRRFVDRELLGSPRRPIRDNVFEVLNATLSGDLDLMPVYGLHHPFLFPSSDSTRHEALWTMGSGLRTRQMLSLQPRPAALIVFGMEEVDLSLAQRELRVVSLADDNLRTILRSGSPDRVLIINAGLLPRNLFHLVIQAANQPVAYEGANLSNLVQVLRRPFISVAPTLSSTPLVEVTDAAQRLPRVREGYQRVYDVSRGLYGPSRSGSAWEIMQRYAQYLGVEPRLPTTVAQPIRTSLRSGTQLSNQDMIRMNSTLVTRGWSVHDTSQFLYQALTFTSGLSNLNLTVDTRQFFGSHHPGMSPSRAQLRGVVLDVHRALPYSFATLLEDLADPGSNVSVYYRWVFERAHSDELRHVLQALDVMRSYMERR